MILFCISILVPLLSALPFEGPSYRSSVMEGDKPILRMMEEPPEPVPESTERSIPAPTEYSEPREKKMVKDMRLLIEWLVDNFGYDIVPEVHRRNDESESLAIEVPEKQALRAADTKKEIKKGPEKRKRVHSLRTKGTEDLLKSADKTSKDPAWMSDLKAFIKDLVSRFGQQDLDRYTKPVMAALEKKHNVQVTDIDGNEKITSVINVGSSLLNLVDQYGEVIIHYIDKASPKKDVKTRRF